MSSSSSSLSDSDSDGLMVSQELRPGFSADRHTTTGGSHHLEDDRHHGSPDVEDPQRDFVTGANSPAGVHAQ